MEKALEKTIETVWKCSVIVEEGMNSQDVPAQKQFFFQQVNEFLRDLHSIDEEAKKLPPIYVDEHVVKKIDEGQNPDLVTQEKLFEAHQKNAYTRGKLFSTKVYADQLTAKLQHHRRLGLDKIGSDTMSQQHVSSSSSSSSSVSSASLSNSSAVTDESVSLPSLSIHPSSMFGLG